MNFKFKLSKRLALIKAALVASTALALACDRTDLISPQPPPRPLAADVTTSLPVLSLTASGYQDPNVPQNTLDNNLATRWSAYGDGQWIRYDLGALTATNAVSIAWYLGDTRSTHFDIQVSLDTVTWTTVFSGQSSGQTLQLETYAFPPVAARYVRIVGHGQWSDPTLLTLWNSITEVAVQGTALPTLSVAAVVASGNDGNIPQNTLDNNLATRWSASGDGHWIRYDLGAVMAVGPVNIAWYRGNEWASAFDIEVSLDAVTWTPVFTGRSNGQTLQPERYDFPVVPGRYVRIVGHGQWSGATQLSLWNSITETAIYGSAAVPLDVVPVASVVASGDDGNVPQNTLDNDLATRWSASGNGQWIRYDLGAVMAVGPVNIAWYHGTEWASAFDIEVSLDSLTWTRVFTGRSNGQTLQPERYDFPTVPGRYVRIVGHGQWTGTTLLSLWNSITEVAIYASAAAPVTAVPVASAIASGDDGHIPQNTLDNNLATRWSASGDGQWIRYDLGAVMAVGPVNVAWYRGTEWASAFDIEVSLDSVTWTRAFTGRSSGQTLQPERYDFPTVPGRYVRIVGHGQWSGATQLSLWNSITEVAIYAAAAAGDPVGGASVTVSPASGSLQVGATVQLAAVTKDAAGNLLTGRTVNWTISNSAVVTVSASGLVTGIAPGSATITATSEGQSGTAAMTVTKVPMATVTVTPAIASMLMGATLQLTATPKDSLGNLVTGRVITWSTNAPGVAAVSASGQVTGLAVGVATITATSEGQSDTAALTVASADPGPQPGPTSTIIFQDGFESGNLNVWQQLPNTGRYSVSTAQAKSGTHSMDVLFTPTNAYGNITTWFMPGYDEIYVKFDVLFGAGFQNLRPDGWGMHFFAIQGNRIDNSQSSWGTAGTVPNGTNYFYAGLDPEEVSLPTLQPFSFYTYWPDMTGTYGNNFYQTSEHGWPTGRQRNPVGERRQEDRRAESALAYHDGFEAQRDHVSQLDEQRSSHRAYLGG